MGTFISSDLPGLGQPAVCADELTAAAFRSPEVEARLMPFWFWNTKMEEDLIRRQIREMALAGVGGFFLHPRQGLETPYLSAQWFERVKLAVEVAGEFGLHVWLYDEYPYPSGMAGGLLTANGPGFRARALDYQQIEASGERTVRREFPMARVVSALACPVDSGQVLWDKAVDLRRFFGVILTHGIFWLWELDHCRYNQKRFMADEGRQIFEWTPPSGEWRLFFGFERDQRGFKYYDWYFDPLCPGASEAFLQITHARYASEVGDHFGGTIRGIFTDETEPPEWSPEIERDLRETHGIDLGLLLPALQEDGHPLASEVRYRFRQSALRLFQERWEEPIDRWCREWGLVWAAEKPTLRPAQFLNFGQPSIDAGHRRVGDPPEPLTAELRTNGRAAMAVAEQCGRGVVRCECFHSMGWGATLQDQKWQIDWLAAQGVNRFTPHAFFADIGGLRKHDAAPSFFSETPAWKFYRTLADYAARLGLALGTGSDVAPIAVLHPTESLWIGGAEGNAARSEYEWLMNGLVAGHRIFHPVDALMLRDARSAGGAIHVGRASYRMLLVPPLAAADQATAGAVRTALRAGLPVLMAAPLAGKNVDGTSVQDIFGQKGITRIESRDQWFAEIDAHLPRELSVALEDGREAGDVWAVWRKTNTQQILFLANTGNDIQRVRTSLSGVGDWTRWRLETGEIKACPKSADGTIALELAPYESALLVGAPLFEPAALTEKVPPAVFLLPTDGLWNITLDRWNALRLNRWQVDGLARTENAPGVLDVEALPLRYFDKAAEEWRQGLMPGPDGVATYRRKVCCRFVPHDLSLLVEDDAIPGAWSLEINGQPVAQERFLTKDFLGTGKKICPVSLYFYEGENQMVLRAEDALATGGLNVPLHLVGSFALAGPDRRELDRLPALAPFGDAVGAGCPHFSGTISYRRKVRLPALKAGDMLELASEDVVELAINGRDLGACAWSPYRWTLPDDVAGEVEVEVRVTNTLLPFLEGQWWNSADRRFQKV